VSPKSARRSVSPKATWTDLVVASPASRTQERPPEHEVVVERGLRVPMRDGVELSALLWRPKGRGRYPVLVERDPHRGEWRTGRAGEYCAARGYAVMHVDLRGCGGSGGKFSGPMPGAPAGDGYDTIEWAASQPWSNGRVGMLCGSISGFTQYQTAVEAPPHLRALFVREAGGGFGPKMAGGPYPLQLLQVVAVSWTEHRLEHLPPAERKRALRLLRRFKLAQDEAQTPTRMAELQAPTSMTQRLPLAPNPLFAGVADYYNDWLLEEAGSSWWKPADLAPKVGQVSVPICHLGAFFDGLLPNTLAAFAGMRTGAATRRAREGQRLLLGPWAHGPEMVGKTQVGLLEFGPNARLDYHAFRGRWYDHHLQGRDTGVQDDPRVWFYLIGPDCWLGCDSWPPPGMVSTPWYLRKGDGQGVLSAAPPTGAEGPEAYEYDPRDPVPALRGWGPFGVGMDQGPIEARLVCYTSPPLENPLALIGPVKTLLHASSSAPDTDWVVRLSWVRPDGTSIVLSGGILRARYRHLLRRPALLEPDRPYCFAVEMMPVSIEIPAGHCLRLSVASSDFPEFDRNLNTGGPASRQRRGQPAINLIFHDRLRPSHVLLPAMR
jgi:putative CocE/NonD family hydrolase